MYSNNCELRVLVKGRPVTEYAHNGNIFIEGRESSDFEIEFINRNSFRVEAVISVDGLSVTDGKAAGNQSGGYLIEANSSTRIPGWMLNDAQAAHFFFSGKNESYATETTGSSRNNGIIGMMVYKEKYAYRPSPTRVYPSPPYYGDPYRGVGGGQLFAGGGSIGSAGTFLNNSVDLGSIQCNNAAGESTSSMAPTSSETWTSAGVSARSSSPQGRAKFDGGSRIERGLRAKARRLIPEPEVRVQASQNLGTGFGEATDFRTTTVQFERGDLLVVAVIYYDDLRGLRSRGVPVVRRSQAHRVNTAPQAFPAATGCEPPRGWKG